MLIQWQAALTRLARPAEAIDDPVVVTFLEGDLVHGCGRRASDVLALAEAWGAVLGHARRLGPDTIEHLMVMAGRVAPGEPMRALVGVLRAALPEPELEARVAKLADPLARHQLSYWLAALVEPDPSARG